MTQPWLANHPTLLDQSCRVTYSELLFAGCGGVDQKEAARRHQRQAAGVPSQVQAQEVFHQGQPHSPTSICVDPELLSDPATNIKSSLSGSYLYGI